MSSACAVAVLDGGPLGPVSLRSRDGVLTWIQLNDGDARPQGSCDLLEELKGQLGDYLDGRRREFEIPREQLEPAGTPWQQAVRDALAEVPWGHCLSYADLAEMAGKSRHHARAAGQACGANAFPLLVPCHRVLAQDGSLGGFGGGLHLKTFLLQLEGHSGLSQ